MTVEISILSLSMFSLHQTASFLSEIETQKKKKEIETQLQVRPYHMLVRKSRRNLRQLMYWQLRVK